MKALFTITCALILMTGRGQKQNFRLKQQALPMGLVFLAGMSDGFVESISHNYSGFKRVFPHAKDTWFDPGMSYLNKYKNRTQGSGERFPGSTNVLVFTTDGYHMGRFAEHLLLAGAFSIKISQQKKNWKVYVLEGLGYWAIHRIGFFTVYNVILK